MSSSSESFVSVEAALSSEDHSDQDQAPPVPPKPQNPDVSSTTPKGIPPVAKDPSSKNPKQCRICRKDDVIVWMCRSCNAVLCETCWSTQLSHLLDDDNPDKHEKVEVETYHRLERIFRQPTQEEQDRRCEADANTTWFGVDKRAEGSFLYYSDCLVDILHNSHSEEYTERYPQLVSFVGQTGAGKSTVIRLLIEREQHRTQQTIDFPAPVPGRVDDKIPTTADVHLYSDPGRIFSRSPILYADCEGLTGGENEPRGRKFLISRQRSGKGRQLAKKLYKQLRWADDDVKKSREFAVQSLFPRILYTFSDVVVFVLGEVRTFESAVLEPLVKWAVASIDKSINQPSRPHLVIVLNAKDPTDGNEWNHHEATRRLLEAYKECVSQKPELRQAVTELASQGLKIETTEQLLEYYYSSVTVVRIPTKTHLTKMEAQVGKLHDIIGKKCIESHNHKREICRLLSAETLPRYLTAAFHHFSRQLDKPFDFVEEAIRHTPPPKNLGGHILNLILMMYHHYDHGKSDTRSLFGRLTQPIASCIMLAVTRGATEGLSSEHLPTYREPLEMAFNEFCSRWLRCSYQKGNLRCCNVKDSHDKGHQEVEEGRIFASGPYQPEFEPEDFFESWFEQISDDIRNKEKARKKSISHDMILGMARSPMEIAKSFHENTMGAFYTKSGPWSNWKHHLTCILCVQEIPEIILPCGHILCKKCILSFGENKGPGLLEIEHCPIHPAPEKGFPAQIKFKPREAGVRVLCLDGGGVRGIVELVILQAIENELGGHIPVQNFFDLIVGTSTGGIIALGLGVKRWTTSECTELFKSLCKEAFTRRFIIKELGLMNHDSIYKAKNFENALKSAFDSYSLLYGVHDPHSSGPHDIKVAVTSTLATKNQAVILSNYNTGGNRDVGELRYALEREHNADTELKIWEAARATSAAPYYFKQFTQKKTCKSFTDGAIHHNCPAVVANNERKLIWEDVSDQPPDIFLSIGTGRGRPEEKGQSRPALFPSRSSGSGKQKPKEAVAGFAYWKHLAFDVIDNQISCERIWSDHYNNVTPVGTKHSMDDKRRNIRLNIEFSGRRPALNDVGALREMERDARVEVNKDPQIREVAHRLIASCFYFEKATRSSQSPDRKGYSSTGNIRCRFRMGSQDLKGLGKILKNLVHGKFEPEFLIQQNYGTKQQKDFSETISREVIEKMCYSGCFQLNSSITVKGAYETSLTRISVRLQPGPYLCPSTTTSGESLSSLPISGFPRQFWVQEIA